MTREETLCIRKPNFLVDAGGDGHTVVFHRQGNLWVIFQTTFIYLTSVILDSWKAL